MGTVTPFGEINLSFTGCLIAAGQVRHDPTRADTRVLRPVSRLSGEPQLLLHCISYIILMYQQSVSALEDLRV